MQMFKCKHSTCIHHWNNMIGSGLPSIKCHKCKHFEKYDYESISLKIKGKSFFEPKDKENIK